MLAIYLSFLNLDKSQILLQDYLAPEIISHFVMHGAGIAEIVKSLITVLRKKDDNVSVIFLEALKRVQFLTSIVLVKFSRWCHLSRANLQIHSFLPHGLISTCFEKYLFAC